MAKFWIKISIIYPCRQYPCHRFAQRGRVESHFILVIAHLRTKVDDLTLPILLSDARLSFRNRPGQGFHYQPRVGVL